MGKSSSRIHHEFSTEHANDMSFMHIIKLLINLFRSITSEKCILKINFVTDFSTSTTSHFMHTTTDLMDNTAV